MRRLSKTCESLKREHILTHISKTTAILLQKIYVLYTGQVTKKEHQQKEKRDNKPAMDSHLTNLLKWSIENTVPAQPDDAEQVKEERAPNHLDTQALQRLLGNAPSDADLMKAAMEVIHDDSATMENKLIAFDNFEQLIENLDNANNMGVLGLWTPLIEVLADNDADMRRMAAWCIGTAVQNNEKAQEKVGCLAPLSPPPTSYLFSICVSIS